MEKYQFAFADKKYELVPERCRELLNDEEYPVEGIDVAAIIGLLRGGEDIEFEPAYFDQPCPACLTGKAEKAPYFKFLEYHFALLTKKGVYVISELTPEYVQTSCERLLREKKVDDSYMASIFVCPECGDYTIEITQCDL